MVQVRILVSERIGQVQDQVNEFLDGRPNSEILDHRIHLPIHLGDPIVTVIWLRTTRKEGKE